MEKKNAVVLLSGGVDSSTVLAFAKSQGYELYALTFDYNQKHKRELDSAKMVSYTLGVKKHLVIKFDLREIGGSALTSEMEVPKTSSFILHPSSFIPATYVPARNTIFLSFGLAWAEVLEAENIFIGANAVDYSGYPDCRPEYLKAFEAMANLATKISVEGRFRFKINAPLIYMKKSDIIKTGMALGLDYSLTWSCYDPQPLTPPSPPLLKGGKGGVIPCGRCDSCVFRAMAFQEAGVKDPLLR
ncbi:MAG: 7-cyano-7-deazaguanine synthase QueC [Nitrospirae bacterium]|jgi:7-cyano-7-deazaguanine synthase|nr:7-cyano-7-deazaguanine synthase QueC [Nitrospirota bacterium]